MKPLAPAIVDALQKSVAAHLTAIENYSGQAAHFARQGYSKLAKSAEDDATEEREHLAKLFSRLETFDTQPAWTHANPSFPAGDFAGILAANLSLETAAAVVERAGILTARASGDEITAKIFAENLGGSEDSIREIEARQIVIADIGMENYLANQV